jgi:hypothetical protein
MKLWQLITIGGLVGLLVFRKPIVNYALSEEQQYYITDLNPVAKPIFSKFIADVTNSGWNVIITGGSRPFDTSTYPNGDYHMYGLGLDINAQNGTTYLSSHSSIQDWIDSGIPALAVKNNIAWGGNFVTPGPDVVHFDLRNLFTLPNLYALYQQQGGDSTQLNLTA